MSFKVGDKVWLFDENRRVYSKEHSMSSAPIYSEHFYQAIIEAETSKSWIVNDDKFSKKNPIGLYTDVQKEDKIWANSNRYKIIDLIKSCSVETLKKIDEILQNENKGERYG